jgi:hypothetical protein
MSDIKADELAFPQPDNKLLVFPGLTKREYFACMALQGLLANASYLPHIGTKYGELNTVHIIAEQVFEMADAMLKEGGGNK